MGPVGDFLDKLVVYIMMIYQWLFDGDRSHGMEPVKNHQRKTNKNFPMTFIEMTNQETFIEFGVTSSAIIMSKSDLR